MPTNKDLKRLVRSRMQKTGESYTAARAQVVRKRAAPPLVRPGSAERANSSGAPAPDYAARAGMSDDAVRAGTGRDWSAWVRLLDDLGAVQMPHRDIARHVRTRFRLSGWWSQGVTVGYERIRGLREVGQLRSGEYEATKSRTFGVPLATLYRAFAASRTRTRWLPGVKLTVRKAVPGKSIRITWEDGTPVEVTFAGKGEQKSQVAIQHRKLASRAAALQTKAFWGERLSALGELLARPGRLRLRS